MAKNPGTGDRRGGRAGVRSPHGNFAHRARDYRLRHLADSLRALRRRAALGGVVGARVARPIENPRDIVLTLDFDTTERVRAFLRFVETQVWTSAAAAPALAGSRRT